MTDPNASAVSEPKLREHAGYFKWLCETSKHPMHHDVRDICDELLAARERIAVLEHDLSRAVANHCADLNPVCEPTATSHLELDGGEAAYGLPQETSL